MIDYYYDLYDYDNNNYYYYCYCCRRKDKGPINFQMMVPQSVLTHEIVYSICREYYNNNNHYLLYIIIIIIIIIILITNNNKSNYNINYNNKQN